VSVSEGDLAEQAALLDGAAAKGAST
jgi:hypothetical protein